MKRLTLPLFFCLLLAANLQADPGPHHGHGDWQPPSAADRVARMNEELGLDENQQAELTKIFEATDAQRDALHAKHEQQIRQDMCALHSSTDQQVKAVLTAEQAAKFDDMLARRAAHREQHHGPQGKGDRRFMDCDPTGA
jgi:Spy/CpxP family protein refolding chaperone